MLLEKDRYSPLNVVSSNIEENYQQVAAISRGDSNRAESRAVEQFVNKTHALGISPSEYTRSPFTLTIVINSSEASEIAVSYAEMYFLFRVFVKTLEIFILLLFTK